MRAVSAAAAALWVCVLVGVLCGPAPARAQGAWQNVSVITIVSSGTEAPRAFASAVALNANGSVLVTGGLYVSPDSPVQASVLFPAGAVLPVTDGPVLLCGDALRSSDGGVTWQSLIAPVAFGNRALHASAAFNEFVGDTRVLLYGGVTYGGVPYGGVSYGSGPPVVVSADSWVLHDSGALWLPLVPRTGPGPRAGHALVSARVQLTDPYRGSTYAAVVFVLIGGARDLTTAVADVWRTDNGGASWYRAHDATNTFGARVGHGAAVISGVPYVVGGMGGPSGAAYNDVWRATDSTFASWELVAADPGTARVGFGAFITGGADVCVAATVNGMGTRLFDATVQAGGYTRSIASLTAAAYVAVSIPNAAKPLAAGAWSPQSALPAGAGLMGAATAFTGTGFLAIGGTGGPANWSSAVLRLPLSALAPLLPTGALNASAPARCFRGYYGCSSTCVACPRGSYSADGAVSCTACEAGFYAPQPAASVCWSCEHGTYTRAAGSASCAACPDGWQSDTTYRRTCYPIPELPAPQSGLSAGAIAGIAVAAAAVLCLAIAWCRRKHANARAAAGGVAAAASPGGAAGLGVLSGAAASPQRVVVEYAGGSPAGTTSPQPAVQLAPVPPVAQPVVVVRSGAPPSADANVSSWQSLF